MSKWGETFVEEDIQVVTFSPDKFQANQRQLQEAQRKLANEMIVAGGLGLLEEEAQVLALKRLTAENLPVGRGDGLAWQAGSVL